MTATEGTTRPRPRDGLALGCLGLLCFSGTAPATRVAAPVFGADVLTWSRIAIAAGLGALTLAATGRMRWPGRMWLPGLLVAGLGQAVGYPLFLALALERVPAYHGAVVIGLVPAATAVLAALRGGERPRALFWIACGAGFCAVLGFALVQGAGTPQQADGWLVAAVLSAAIGYVEGARVSRAIGAVPTLCWAMLLLAPAAALGVLIGRHDLATVTPAAWAGFGYAGVVSMFLGSIAWYQALATGGTARIGQLNLAQPFLAITWSALLLAEHITWTVLTATAAVLACMTTCLHTRPTVPGTAQVPCQPQGTWPNDR